MHSQWDTTVYLGSRAALGLATFVALLVSSGPERIDTASPGGSAPTRAIRAGQVDDIEAACGGFNPFFVTTTFVRTADPGHQAGDPAIYANLAARIRCPPGRHSWWFGP